MPSGNSPRVILYDSEGNVPLQGSLAASGSIPVAIANDQIVQVSGTLFVQPLPGVTGSITGSVGLSGPVAVSNFPAVQNVTGSAWIPTVTGSVVVSNQVNVTGSVGITAPVTVLPHSIISGSVTGLLVGGQAVSSTNPLPVTGSISVGGVVAISGALDVTGSVLVKNRVDVSGSAWTPTITGSITVINRVDVSGSNWIPTVTGSIGIAAPVAVTQGTSPWVISGSSWTPTITGSVVVTNRVDVTGSNWVGVVAGQNGTNFKTLQTDTSGNLITTTQAAAATNAGFVFGKLDTTLQSLAVIEHTTYTEQSSNSQRSIVSTSGSDHWNSGSAQQVTITYYTVSGSGPKTEIINLSGTTAVNTVNTDICYIERIEVTRAGAYTTNSGTISLKAAINGGGATIGSIGGSAGQTFWCHHYIPSGSTCYITGLLGGKFNNTSAGSGGTFHIKATPLGLGALQANAISRQASDFVNGYGQANTVERIYSTPIAVTGPQKLAVWVYPDSALTTTYIASIDFYER